MMLDQKMGFLVSCSVFFITMTYILGIFHLKKSSCDIYVDLPNIAIRNKWEVLYKIDKEACLKLKDLFSSRTEIKLLSFNNLIRELELNFLDRSHKGLLFCSLLSKSWNMVPTTSGKHEGVIYEQRDSSLQRDSMLVSLLGIKYKSGDPKLRKIYKTSWNSCCVLLRQMQNYFKKNLPII